jgi:predicted 3-demethylubiquinone-9 3-methyltransferase (glyoxalase superfamily)
MTVSFELDGQPFVALNGGPEFTFSEAIAFEISCESQEEVDRYTEQLIADVMASMLKMHKLDVAELERAAAAA